MRMIELAKKKDGMVRCSCSGLNPDCFRCGGSGSINPKERPRVFGGHLKTGKLPKANQRAWQNRLKAKAAKSTLRRSAEGRKKIRDMALEGLTKGKLERKRLAKIEQEEARKKKIAKKKANKLTRGSMTRAEFQKKRAEKKKNSAKRPPNTKSISRKRKHRKKKPGKENQPIENEKKVLSGSHFSLLSNEEMSRLSKKIDK